MWEAQVSHPWAGADAFYNHAQWRTIAYTPTNNLALLREWDILLLDFDGDGTKDHWMFVTYRYWTEPHEFLLAWHTTDRFDRSFEYVLQTNPDADFYWIRIREYVEQWWRD